MGERRVPQKGELAGKEYEKWVFSLRGYGCWCGDTERRRLRLGLLPHVAAGKGQTNIRLLTLQRFSYL
jgi:hypothetical protein